jgi:hypothetical protein
MSAEIVLLSADGLGTNEIMRRTGKSKTCVWRGQERFLQAGYDNLLYDKTRPSRIRPLGSNITERVVALTQTEPPAEATLWTAAMMAKLVDISAACARPSSAENCRPGSAGSRAVGTSCHLERRGCLVWWPLSSEARTCSKPVLILFGACSSPVMSLLNPSSKNEPSKLTRRNHRRIRRRLELPGLPFAFFPR